MRRVNILSFSTAVAFTLANIIWMFFNKYDLSVYFNVITIVYLITVWIYISLKPDSRFVITLNGAGAILFAGCLVLIVGKILRIMS